MTHHCRSFITNLMPLKVSKSWKQILKFSFEPKRERKYFCISVLASKNSQKNKFFGVNENFKICFWDLLTFNTEIIFFLLVTSTNIQLKSHKLIFSPVNSSNLSALLILLGKRLFAWRHKTWPNWGPSTRQKVENTFKGAFILPNYEIKLPSQFFLDGRSSKTT